MDYKLWVSYHKDQQITDYNLTEDETHTLFATHKPVEEENINHMNPVYSEMVTMWYVWKNQKKSKYVGFEHYRRHFDEIRLPKAGECQVYKIVDFDLETVYDQYARCHSRADIDLMLQCIDNRYGEGNKYTRNIRESHWLIANCCFIMKWQDFVKMCEFLFPLLDDFAASLGISNTNVKEWRKKIVTDFGETNKTDYQTRILSFLAERLISAWIGTNLFFYAERRDIAIVHYNTPELTEAAIRSLNRYTPGYYVTVFDNSDKKPFKTKLRNVKVIDNTKGQVIDFEAELAKYPDKDETDIAIANYGSAKHTMSVQKLMELLPDGFILMDSDVLVKKNFDRLWDKNFACGGKVVQKKGIDLLRPFLCWINVPMLRSCGVTYFNGSKMWALSKEEPNTHYDTGAWFLEDVTKRRLPIGYVDIDAYILHFGHGSWGKKEDESEMWLKENEALWQ